MSDFKKYQRTAIAEMRPYIAGEILPSQVSISEADSKNGSPKLGDMIARNPKNHDDQWLVAADYFADNFCEEKQAADLIEQLQQRIAELERKNHCQSEQLNQYATENEELAATVERLRVNGAKVCLEFPDKITETMKEFMLTVSPYGYSGQANLNHVKREVAFNAYRDGFISACDWHEPVLQDAYSPAFEKELSQYISSKYPTGE